MKESGVGVAPAAIMSEQVKQQQENAAKLRERIFRELPEAQQWLNSQNVWLRGQTPQEALADGRLDAVQELLDSILFVGIV